MKIMLFTPHSFRTILLPEKCAGQYWVYAKDPSGKNMKIIAVEGSRAADAGEEPRWILKSNSRYQIVDDKGQTVPRITLEPRSLHTIQSADGKRAYRLFTEPLSEDRKIYRAYKITDSDISLRVGRLPDCDIQYASNLISKLHAVLQVSGGQIRIADKGSLNGTFVNGHTVERETLKTGDVIFLMGLQMVVTPQYLFINDPDGQVTVRTSALQQIRLPAYEPRKSAYDESEDPEEDDDFYYRAPRFKHDVETLELKLDAPPAPQTEDGMPLIMSLGPSVTMGMASATTSAYAVYNAVSSGNIASSIPSIAMGAGMLAGTLLWPLITKSYQKKARGRKEAARRSAYTAYLEDMEQRILREMEEQKRIRCDNDGDIRSYLDRFSAQSLQIWERTPKHTDFLKLRLGIGQLPLDADIRYPERRFSVEPDPLTEAMYQFGEKERCLEDVPICLPLVERFVSGIYADRAQLITYAKSLILQLVTLHSYDEVKLVLIYDEADEKELSFVRWLPHVMSNERSVRYIATNYEEAKNLSADLEPIIEYRKELSADLLEDESPYFVVLCLDKKLASRAEFLNTVLEHKENIKFSVIAMYERLKDLPKECGAVVEVDGSAGGSLTMLNDVCDPPLRFRTDLPPALDMSRVTQVLANTQMDITDSKFQLPKKYTFLEMLDVGMVEHINLLENWSSNDPTRSLAAPIGIDRFGERFVLDLHERAHGPHGLIAGMTGSGKSETIIAYILSMAVNYHPNEVAFILIDYKGGGMAKAFENIPHTAGIITNLDGSAINRSLVSMQSELHRRELIFQKVSKQQNISNIDIYKYQKMYREGKVSEPLPHLIIISDEFAELKKDQPDFMAALTSTARVGRSLGVHLILATQKPGGVVDDQIRSNSRFRLCLKVQDKGDSTEMMGRPEAAALVETGRFYLQVGNNELFELGHSAWAGAPYHPSSKVIKDLNDAISVIDTNGRVVAEVNNDRFPNSKDARKQLDAITEYIREVSEAEHIPSWKMWLDPIPAAIYTDDLARKYSAAAQPFVLEPIIGEYDDPAHQSQNILRLPLSREGNAIVYGSAGSGKGMFLEAMCHSLLHDHTADEVNLYILDFGSETLTAFSEAPHVGDVILSHETEKVENLFKLLHGKVNTRKKILSQFGGSLEQYNIQSPKSEPNIVVIINNFANFSEFFESKLGDINYLTREGTKYGIYFVLSCTGVNNVRFNLLQNFKSIFCLQMNNPDDYSNVVGKTNGLQLEKHKGRGMLRMGKESVLEFQTARVTREENPYAFYRKDCAALAGRSAGRRAAGVPVLPEVVSVDFLSRYCGDGDLSRVPVGIRKESLEIAFHDFSGQPVHMVLAANQEWKRFTESLAVLLSEQCAFDTILIAPAGCSPSVSGSDKLRICASRNSCAQAARDIFQQTLVRNNTYKEALAADHTAPTFSPMFVIVQSMAQLKTLLAGYAPTAAEASDDTPLNRLQVAMEKCAREYAIYFIVAESIQALTPFTAEKWYKAQVNGNSGIWIGSGISTQYRLNVNTKPQGFNSPQPEPFGFQVNNGEAVLVKFLQ